jgi:putative transcriptional regulator
MMPAMGRGDRSLKGRLLVATPVVGDPDFTRAVVLVLDHGPEGALGVLLNRPTDLAVLDPMPAWDDLAADPAVVFLGGPVDQGAAIGLARRGLVAPPAAAAGSGADGEVGGWSEVLGDIGTFDLNRSPLDDAAIEEVRIFVGYAGWGPGQLEDELALDAWITVDAHPTDVLSDEPDQLWSRVLHRQGGHLTVLSYLPADPSLN